MDGRKKDGSPLTSTEVKIPILLVDDRDLDLDLTRKTIQNFELSQPVEIFSTTSGSQAIRMCEDKEYGVIFLDVKMPVMDGFECARGIRQTTRNKSTPIVFLTSAYDDPEALRQAYEVGASDFLSKPPSTLILRNKLDLFIRLASQRFDLKNAHIIALEALQAKTNFLAVVSHEIRTPLNMICGIVDDLEEEGSLVKGITHLEYLKASTQYLLHLIESVMDLTRIDIKGMPLETNQVWIGDLLNDVIYGLQARAREKDIKLLHSIGSGVPEVIMGDSVRIRQIIINLVNNAIKFTNEGYVKVTVDAVPHGPTKCALSIAVSDTGIGIPKEMHAQIFESFAQVDMSPSRKYSGLGIGLALVTQLAALMDGKVDIESIPGKGSTFTFTANFECNVADAKNPLDAEKSNVLSIRSGPVLPDKEVIILMIEDDPSNQKIFEIFLRNSKCVLDIAKNGVDGLERFKTRRYDLVFMDLYMPIMDGLEATAKIREFETADGRKRVPMVGVTACVNIDENNKMLEHGCDLVVKKPIKKTQVFELIAQYTKGTDTSTKTGT